MKVRCGSITGEDWADSWRSGPDGTRRQDHLTRDHPEAADENWAAVYGELERIAVRCFRTEAPGHTLQATALVNEAFVRLAGTDPHLFEDRVHFLAMAEKTMRRILVDDARRRRAVKHGGEWKRVPLNEANEPVIHLDDELLDLDDALHRLDGFDPRLARLVELRFFGGLTYEEAARVLRVSPITAKRMWRMARYWLLRKIGSGD